MRVRGALLAVVFGLVVALVPAVPAQAHSVGGVGATNFRTTLSALEPAVPGVGLSVIENGSLLELRNTTASVVTVAGYGGEPYARVGPAGVDINDNSPATYLNVDRYSTTPVPATADGKGPPAWRHVSDEPVWHWHDHRVHWMLTTLPPVVAASPAQFHQISQWSVQLWYGDAMTPMTATGTLDWVPGPSPWPWFLLLAVLAVGVAALAWLRRPQRPLAVTVAVLLGAYLVHGIGVAAVIVGSVPQKLDGLLGAEAFLVWPFAALICALLWRRHVRAAWLAAGLGLVVGGELVLDDAPVWWRSSAPTSLPSTVNRLSVALVVGIGAGLVVVLPLLLRRHRPADVGWSVPAARPAPPAPVEAAEVETAEVEAAEAEAAAEQQEAAYPQEPVPAPTGIGRRQVAGLIAAGAVGAFAGGTIAATAAGRSAAPAAAGTPLGDVGVRVVAFTGAHQAGIADPGRPQAHGWVAGLDLLPGVDRAALRNLLRAWTDAARALTAGRPLGAPDDAVVAGLGPAALTVTVGFGPTLFGKAGIPAAARPDGLAPLPAFAGEALDPAGSDGDLGLVLAADDPVVLAHAARVLTRLAGPAARVRWQQTGFNTARGADPDSATRRNLMGQVDGTNNPQLSDVDFAQRIFAAPDAPDWLRGGSYLVVRRIRMLLDDWDNVSIVDKERVIGRRLDTGAPLTGGQERTVVDLGAVDPSGALVIPADAHIRLAAPANNNGAAMLRRGFSYADAAGAGLLFLAWQADPRTGFIPVQQRLAGVDALSRFIRHESSALFGMPGGVGDDTYLGQSLVEAT